MVTLDPQNDGRRDIRLLIIFLVIGVVLITVWFRESDNGPLHAIRSGATVVTSPIEHAGAALSTPFIAIGNAMTNITASSEDLTTLREKNAELTSTVTELEEYRQENERLKGLLGIEETYGVEGITSTIIGRNVDTYSGAITIDKGSDDGVISGMPVMDANGLIGQVDSVNPTSSVVRLLSDAGSGVAAIVQSSRVEGIVTGSTEGLLYLSYVPVDKTVTAGDVVITSGIGGAFPKGILIGEVVSVYSAPNDLYQTIVVSGTGTDESLEEVLVVTGSKTTG